MPERRTWLVLLAVILVLIVMLPYSPLFQPPPPFDAGVFQYMGSQILAGRLPYRDVFDHKPPVIYYLNALGLLIGPGSMWGIWVVETVLVGLAALFAAHLLARVWGQVPAGFGLTGGLLTLSSVLHGGHYPEDFALVFQMAALAIFEKAERRGRWGGLGVWLGVAVGLAFFTKPTLVSVGIAVAMFLIIKILLNRCWTRLMDLGWMGVGFSGVAAVILGYFVWQGAWADFVAAYEYNQAYASLGLLERTSAILDTLKKLFIVPGFVLVFAGWLAGLAAFLFMNGLRLADWLRERRLGYWEAGLGIMFLLAGLAGDVIGGQVNMGMGLAQWIAVLLGAALLMFGWFHTRGIFGRRLSGWLEVQRIKLLPEKQALLGVAVLCFPLDVGMISLSARNYVYYYIALIPVSFLLLAYLADHLLHHQLREKALAYAWLGALLAAIIAGPMLELPSLYRRGEDRDLNAAVAYIQTNTTQVDSVLTWGAAPTVNFYSGRPAPSRFVYKYPFYQQDQGSKSRSVQFVNDLKLNRPKYIVDTMNDDQPFVGTPGTPSCLPGDNNLPDGLQDVFGYICQNYRLVESVQPGNWRIFEAVGK